MDWEAERSCLKSPGWVDESWPAQGLAVLLWELPRFFLIFFFLFLIEYECLSQDLQRT